MRSGLRPGLQSRRRRLPAWMRSRARWPTSRTAPARSEEHTSELQSHHDLVCRLLLEKKKNCATRLARSNALLTIILRSTTKKMRLPAMRFFFFFNDTATTEIYTLSLHDALPI